MTLRIVPGAKPLAVYSDLPERNIPALTTILMGLLDNVPHRALAEDLHARGVRAPVEPSPTQAAIIASLDAESPLMRGGRWVNEPDTDRCVNIVRSGHASVRCRLDQDHPGPCEPTP